MPKSLTHNEIVFRPPPGTRFTIWGSDILLEFERGREREIFQSLGQWLNDVVYPEVERAEAPAFDPTPEVTALQKRIAEDMRRVPGMHSAVGNPAVPTGPIHTSAEFREIEARNKNEALRLRNSSLQNQQNPEAQHEANRAKQLADAQKRLAEAQAHLAAVEAAKASTPIAPPVHTNAKQVVYGPQGMMTQEQINALPDKPLPGIGYVSPEEAKIPPKPVVQVPQTPISPEPQPPTEEPQTSTESSEPQTETK